MISVSLELTSFFKLSIVLQINMPKCQKIYQNCIWQVLTEWHTLGFYSALLTKVYWNYTTHLPYASVRHTVFAKNLQTGSH